MRASGILLHITSLPSPYGVGTLGKEAFAFVDFLKKANQKYWQILPLGPTGYGDSPYQTDSAFAGNPYLIDLDALAEDGLLTKEEINAPFWGSDAGHTDYGALYAGRAPLLKSACDRGWERDREAVASFCRENPWVEDYALFKALKGHFGMKPWIEWEDEDIRLRRSDAVLEKYRNALAEDIRVQIYTQYLFFRQWDALRTYAREQGIGIIGDVPIYVPMDSADVWAESEYFQLDEERRPRAVAGVPPDYFSADGQLWGNPLYDWEKMQADGYRWWIRRMQAASRLYDVVRIDHFRGLESYWAVPYGETTARNGRWCKGPGESFIIALREHLPQVEIIAEDLGFLTQEVIDLREFSGYPGMKILEFAFDSREPSNYLPHCYDENCICYTGTHDNATLRQWLDDAAPEDVAFAREYFSLREEDDFNLGVIRGGMRSVAKLFVAQMQDWLDLGGEARMNTPGILGNGNWCWRMAPNTLRDELAWKIARMTYIYGRC